MKLLDSVRFRLGAHFRRSHMDADMEDELRSHVQHRADDLERSGLPRAEAERRARVEFGAYQRFREECHEAAGGTLVEPFLQDMRYSLRMLRKSPGFAAVAVVTLALAIGANAVVFSVLNGLVLRPLNVPQVESLWLLEHAGDEDASQSYADYLDLRDRNRSFDALTAFNSSQAALETGQERSLAWVYEVSGNYFDALRIQPHLGRLFHSSDEHGTNSAPYVVLSHAYWHSHFQDDRGVVGRTVRVNKHPFTIVGVAPPAFNGTLLFFHPDLYVPIVNQQQIDGANLLDARGNRWVFEVQGHLRAGVTRQQAIADLNSIGSYLEKTYPKEDANMAFTLARPGLHGDYLRGPMLGFLAGLMLLAALILLAACANLGSLFAARAADRSREIALRLALGSSRLRILRQLFTEALLISVLGGAVGLWGGAAVLRGLSGWQPFPRYPIHVPVNPDANVYGVALLLALASGFLFGAVPVRQVLRADPYEIVKSGGSGRAGRRITVRDALLVVQIAICAVLVTSSMVAVRGLARSLHSNFGFEPRNTMLVDTNLSVAGYSSDTAAAMQKRMIEALAGIPGVESTGLADAIPFADSWASLNVFTDGTTDLSPGKAAADAFMYHVSPEYFRAAGTALLSGRDFTWHDDKNAPRVAVVNREFARRLFGSARSALGGYYELPDGMRIQVVGIVEDGKYWSFTERPQPAMFFSILQMPSSSTCLVVRSSRDPRELAADIRRTVRGLDEGLLVNIQTRYTVLDEKLFGARMATVALGVLGGMGAMLSVTGIFGLAAYSVSKRLRELGIRMALGAQRKEVLKAALGRPFKLLALGSVAGVFLGILASRVLAHIVDQATPRDPLVLAGVVLAMAFVGVLATWLPAQRALSIDPVMLMREE